MLAEGIVGQEQPLLRQVGEHAVWPVEHRGFDKGEPSLSQTDLIARAHRLPLPIPRAEVAAQGLLYLGCAHQRRLGGQFHDCRDRAGMIDLPVVGDHKVDLSRIDQFLDTFDHLFRKLGRHRVHQCDLLIQDKIGVVGGASVGGVSVAMKVPHIPIYGPHPVHIFNHLDFHGLFSSTSSSQRPPSTEQARLFTFARYSGPGERSSR